MIIRKIIKKIHCGSTNYLYLVDNMRAEEQLKLAYITIAQLKDQNAKLVDAVASLERRIAESDGRERRMVEEFYTGLIEDMKAAQAKEIAQLRETMQATIDSLIAQVSSLSASGRVKSGKLYGRKSEKSSRLDRRRDEDDRDRGRDDFDGTAGSDVSGGSSASEPKSGTESGAPSEALRRKLLRKYPGCELHIERVDYSKASAYTDNPQFHRIEDYYSLPSGACFVTRDGQIDKSLVRVLIYHPGTIEEHIYETATVRFKDADDIRTIDTLELDRPVKGCCFGVETLCYILQEKFWYNTPFDQIVRKLRAKGVRMSKSTLGDNIHRAIAHMRIKMRECWESVLLSAKYWMIDETPGLVGCRCEDGSREYKKKYFWCITANVLRLVWMFYEEGSRGAKVIRPFLERFIGFYTTDGYICYKVFDTSDGDDAGEEGPPAVERWRSACLVHIRRLFVFALEEDYEKAMWFIERMALIFAKEYSFRVQKLTNEERLAARLKPGSTEALMKSIEDKLDEYAQSDDVGCGELMRKALRYARSEWPAMKWVLENGDVEISNNISEQPVRKLKMNLRNAGNIGSESSAADNAFMYSVIESCRLNDIDPGKYLRHLLNSLKSHRDGDDLTGLLPCYCTL